MISPAPRSSPSDNAFGQRAELKAYPSLGFQYNGTLNAGGDEDAMGEPELAAQQNPPVSDTLLRQKNEPDSATGENNGTGPAPKRKRPLKLTALQRERKRAIDREAQRSIRIKTKNYIAHLEGLVKVMEETDTTGPDGENNKTRELMNQLRQSQEEVRRLRETMLGVQRLLGGALTDHLVERPGHQGSTSASPPSVLDAPVGVNFLLPHATSAEGLTNWMLPKQSNDHSSTTPETIHPIQPHQEPPSRPHKDPSKRKVEGEMFYYSEWHLNQVHAVGPAAFGNQPFDEDIAVRAIVEGWPAVEERYDLDLAWQALREIDQVVFPEAGVVERIGALRLLRLNLLYQINKTSSAPQATMNLPLHMTREVTDLGNHAHIIDNFVWPGFRRALTEHPEKYITNRFNEKYRVNLKFLWPYEVGDIYQVNPMTQLYECSAEFLRRHMDIRCWTMRRQFFEGAEELLPAIPAFEAPIQKALTAPRNNSYPDIAHHHQQQSMGMVEEHEVQEADLVPLSSDSLSAVSSHAPIAHHSGLQHAADMAQWHQPQPLSGQHGASAVHRGQSYWQPEVAAEMFAFTGHVEPSQRPERQPHRGGHM